MRYLVFAVFIACGGPLEVESETGSLTWACETPRCCVGTLEECRDFGCCDPEPVVPAVPVVSPVAPKMEN